MANDKGISKEDLSRIQYLDNREYQAKFLLDPDIAGEEDFKHLDKNLAITNLKHNPKLHINEVEEARSILRGLHILNNSKHYDEEEKEILVGHKEQPRKDGSILLKPIYEQRKIRQSKFPKTYHSLRSEFISLVNTTAARNGHRMNAAITNRLEKTETVQQRTQAKSKWGFNQKQY